MVNIPGISNDASVQLSSSILGMEVLVETVNDSPGIEIAESLLATMESFLSTLIQIHAVARVETFFIILVENEILADIVTYKTDHDGNNRLIVEYRNFSPHQLSKEEQNIIGDLIFEIIKYLLINTIAIQDSINVLGKLFDGEKVTERTSSFLTSMVTLGNVLGYSPRRSIRSWCTEKFKEYPLEPDEKRILISQGLKNKKKSQDLDSSSHESISHANVKTLSIIDENLWESARWGGLSFATYSSPISPPLLAFMFWDGIKAKEIFKRWRERYGENLFQHIKLVILKGINKFEPHW